jgi:hypothetical protein
MNIYCDRYSECHSMYMDRGEKTEEMARAKGWSIWRGKTLGGKDQEVILCDKCVEAGRRVSRPKLVPLDGQYPIPELRIVKPGE